MRNLVFFFFFVFNTLMFATLLLLPLPLLLPLNWNFIRTFFSTHSVVVVVSVFDFACIYANNFSLCCVFVTCSLSVSPSFALSPSHTTTKYNTLKQRLIVPAIKTNIKRNEMISIKFWIDEKCLFPLDNCICGEGILDTTNAMHDLCFDIRMSSVVYLCVSNTFIQGVCLCNANAMVAAFFYRICYVRSLSVALSLSV